VTWTATDDAGNTSTCTQTVTVNDTEKPIINCIPTLPVFCHNTTGTYTIPLVTAFDNCNFVSIQYSISGATIRSGFGNNASGSFNVGTSIITWTATDGSGNNTTCQTNIIVNPILNSTIPDNYAINPGGTLNTIYFGYTPASVITLNGVVSGGTVPYSYKWTIGSSSGPSLGINASFTVSATFETTYYLNVKDNYGCTVAAVTKTIYVIDVRCGPKLEKVNVCVNKNGKYTSNCIIAGNVSNYLASGSYLGACSNTVLAVKTENRVEVDGVNDLTVKALPNPSRNYFTLITNSKIEKPIFIKVTDLIGRVIETKHIISANSTFRLGQNYHHGVYIVEVLQGNKKVVLKLLKQPKW